MARCESEERRFDQLSSLKQKPKRPAREGHRRWASEEIAPALTGPHEKVAGSVCYSAAMAGRSIVDRVFLNGLELNVVIITSHPYLKAVLTLALFSSFFSLSLSLSLTGEPVSQPQA